jgi:uncharacterized protein
MQSSEAQRIFTLILEPVKGCNLRCIYCYSDTGSGAVMSRQTLRVAIESAARYAERYDFTQIHILWHGGEPLLAGLEFFRYATRIIAELSSSPRFQHFLQTNGLLLDRDFCRFFRENEFQVGISLDGPPEVHDAMRISADGEGSHERVRDKLRLLAETGLGSGFNAVVTRGSLGREKEIYRYFQALGYGFRVNPMIPGINPERSTPDLLRPGEYGRFLCGLFDAWTGTEVRRIPVSPLDVYLKAILENAPYECQQRPTCVGSHLGVKPNGDAVLCSRFETHVLGNIHEMRVEALFASPFCEMIRRRTERLTDCHSCAHWAVCHGGCPHNALSFCQDPMAKDYFCKDYQLVFGKIRRALSALSKEEPAQDEP